MPVDDSKNPESQKPPIVPMIIVGFLLAIAVLGYFFR